MNDLDDRRKILKYLFSEKAYIPVLSCFNMTKPKYFSFQQ